MSVAFAFSSSERMVEIPPGVSGEFKERWGDAERGFGKFPTRDRLGGRMVISKMNQFKYIGSSSLGPTRDVTCPDT